MTLWVSCVQPLDDDFSALLGPFSASAFDYAFHRQGHALFVLQFEQAKSKRAAATPSNRMSTFSV
jgi:hypothetical protein